LSKVIITTSRRPTQTSRKFVKILSMIIPNSLKITRGKYTINSLLLQALDLNAEKIIIIRNKKGNPGYIDVYSVDIANFILSKLCNIKICGYKLIEDYKHISTNNQIILLEDNLSRIDLDEYTLTCIFKCFNINIVSSKFLCKDRNILEAYIEKVDKNINNIYELSFKDCKGNLKGMVLKICPTKTIKQR